MKTILSANIDRRSFLKKAGAVATFTLAASTTVLHKAGAQTPSAKLNLAFIGAGGRAEANLSGLNGENVVALCDVDNQRSEAARKKYPNAKFYRDWRKMFDEMEKSIDAVVVSTPDHTHAVAAMAAIKRGKHIYCEKPLAHSIGEVRALMEAAKKQNVVSQLGNQGHSFDTIRTFYEWIKDGAIGNVHTIHAFASAKYSRLDQLDTLKQEFPVPEWLDWDLWLGPAPYRPYNPAYLPGKWRGWSAFGTGMIGDWICHVVDPSFWALDLGSPISVQAEAKNYDPKKHYETFPYGSKITFEFAPTKSRGAIKLIWYDGVEKPPRPADLEPDDRLPDTGAVVIGDKGTIIHGSHGAGGVRLIPDSKMQAYQKPPKTLPRVKNHYADWLNAIRNKQKAGSDFSYGGPLTELALIGIIAIRFLGEKLLWDGKNAKFTNNNEANKFIQPQFRNGWSL
ncbi:MAG: Gfo/Idh/MocA family protein [Verrucomicrobiia bacterium]